ncbi:hypothetical protein RB653_000904 [Dictyostelium firmibasis]|uniref:Uncharacterized protein n=1 Tax=Dictyostelium firmibasis TaxID=79012 RepID=A0AAN7Z1J6_9MYCE
MLSKSNNIKKVISRRFITYVQRGKFEVETKETIGDRIGTICKQFKYSDALTIPDHNNYSLTYGDILQNAGGLANGFVEHSIKDNQTIVSNSFGVDSALIHMAASCAGLNYVSVPPTSTFSEIGTHLNGQKASTLIMADSNQRVMVKEALEFFPNLLTIYNDEYHRDNRFPALKHIFSTGGSQQPGISLLKDIVLSKTSPNKNVENTHISTTYPVADGNYVSFTQKSILNTADALAEYFDIKPNERFSFAVPLYEGNATAFYLACLSKGAMVGFISQITPSTILNSIIRDKFEHLFISSSNLNTLVSSMEFAQIQTIPLKRLIVVGECDDSIVKRFESKCVDLKTSIFPFAHIGQISGAVFNSSGFGELLPKVEGKIVDENGKELDFDSRGSLMTKGFHVGSNPTHWLKTNIKASINKNGTIKL